MMASEIVKYILVVCLFLCVCVANDSNESLGSDRNASPDVLYAGFKETPNNMLEMEASEAMGALVLDRLGADQNNNFPDCCFQQCTEKDNCDLVIVWTEASQCVLMSCRPAQVCKFSTEGAIGFKMFLKEDSEVVQKVAVATEDPISFPEAEENENGIDSEKDPADEENVPACDQPKRIGPCRAAFPRFYFNKKNGECEPFIYGGCRPNKNNFQTKEACLSACGGGGKDNEEPKSEASTDDVTVEKKNEEAKNVLPICEQPKKVGICKAAITRFYFDLESKSCEKFVYGGCQGNENNFKTKKECTSACVDKNLIVDDELENSPNETEEQNVLPICEQPKKVGMCKAAITRFYFDLESKSCEKFVYGGCQGNGNNFKTKKECTSACVDKSLIVNDELENSPNETEEQKVPEICEQPKKVGMCEAAITRFYFDLKSKSCEKFVYGGCQGNENNFKTKKECTSTCVDKTLIVDDELEHSPNETEEQNADPFHSAHRQNFKHEDGRGLQMMSPAYQLEAVVPLVIGALISMAMLVLVIYRCHINRQTGPKRLHKIVYDGPPPTIGELHSEDDVVNGMYT